MQTPANSSSTPAAPGLSRLGLLLLIAIGLIVVLVSLPRLRAFALSENQKDAQNTLVLLGQRLLEAPQGPALCIERLAHTRWTQRALRDGEFLADGELLRRHGYLFRLVCGPLDQPVVVAWPWSHDRTGQAAYVFGPWGVLMHDNQDARYDGPQAAPRMPFALALGWTPLRSPAQLAEGELAFAEQL